jgi:hypothetical protein
VTASSFPSGRRRRLWVGLFLLASAGCRKQAPPVAEQRPPTPAADTTLGVAATDSEARSAAEFTQAFYAWYSQRGNRFETAIRQRTAVFSPQLLEAMRADFQAQEKSPDDIAGLDWDPFLGTQDPCEPYRVGQTSRRSDTILVAVKGMCADAEPLPGPDVFAEVGRSGGQWVFLDFRHGRDRGSLLSDLASLRLARDSAAARRGK